MSTENNTSIQPPEKGTFGIIGPKSKLIKLLSNETLDAKYICACFKDVAPNIKPDDILGVRAQNGILIRLTNSKLSEVMDGKLCTLELSVNPDEEKEEKELDVNNANRYLNPGESAIKGGWNLLAGKTEAAHFYSKRDGGNEALKKMNDWMKANDKCKIQNIYKDFMFANGAYHYWYGLVFTRFHEQ
eukprot:CAMPEP_0201577482 /NCGR_PEP_ID=MMETSP0190_2-20130828/23903_1 /ASSEMBLY_ACC=CAM_ASM_000263 /TAXON_ID=37353 /ORGANISM="Rosalina sp." /LENGTH=186 /DNA_ID=CAMNT_0048009577 /DNA_START=72 /DNA_END=632 /DNA_ORIENTATION=+